jgi:hypothetical protein
MTNTNRIAVVTCVHVVVWFMLSVMHAAGQKETPTATVQ